MNHLPLTTISFPDIKVHPSKAHKLRGYIANLFGEHSDLFHNHDQEGKYIYRYPLIQYKVVRQTPYLLGLQEGGELLAKIFLALKEIKLDDEIIPLNSKNIQNSLFEPQVSDQLYTYRFETLWMALNQKNHTEYIKADKQQKNQLLNNILRNHILLFYKGIGYWAEQKIMVSVNLEENKTQFKGKPMLAFQGTFVTNALLPDWIGLGKSPSRGFGTIKRIL